MLFWGIKLHQIVIGEIWENKHCWKISMLLICEKESQVQDLWNRESKSNTKRSDGG